MGEVPGDENSGDEVAAMVHKCISQMVQVNITITLKQLLYMNIIALL